MNNIEFALSGKAGIKGSESIGIDDDSLKTRLYNQCQRDSEVESRLSVAFESIDGCPYSLYHYLKPRNVAQKRTKDDEEKDRKHGRAGSYLALTVRIKGKYCTDFKFVYRVLEEAFNKHIVNKILSKTDTDGYWEYQVNELSETEKYLEEIEKDINSEFDKHPQLFEDLPSLSIGHSSGTIIKKDFGKTNLKKCVDDLASGVELYLSPDYKAQSSKHKSKDSKKGEEEKQDIGSGVPKDDTQNIENEHNNTLPTNISYQEVHLDSENNEDSPSGSDTMPNGRDGNNDKTKLIKYAMGFVVIMIIILGPLRSLFSHDDAADTKKETVEKTTFQDTKVEEDPAIESTEYGITESESYPVSRLDIKGDSYFLKGECYKLTAKVKVDKNEQNALGKGGFIVEEENVWMHQDKAICIVYIPMDFSEDTVHISYHYQYAEKDTSITRKVFVSDRPINKR